jgi:hypothetical protein
MAYEITPELVDAIELFWIDLADVALESRLKFLRGDGVDPDSADADFVNPEFADALEDASYRVRDWLLAIGKISHADLP